MQIEIRPLQDYLLCEYIVEKQTTKQGIILTTEKKATEKQAKVLKAGPLSERSPGDVIIYKAYAADKIEIHDQTYILIKDQDVIALMC